MNHADRGHSSIGASSCHRWMECPASVKLSNNIPSTTSQYAEEGTCAHELAEAALLSDNKDCREFIGQTFNNFVVSSEMADYVQLYVDYVLKESEDGDLLLEETFDLPDIHPDAFGTNDACIVRTNSGVVIDLKYGKGVEVSAKDNRQLLYYALGAFPDLSKLEELKLVIVQPRIDDPIKEWTIKPEVLEKFASDLRKSVKEVFSDNPRMKTGRHCTFCKAQAICPQMRKETMEVVGSEFDKTPVEELNLPSPEALSTDQVVKILEAKTKISKWMDSIYAYAMDQATKGNKIPSYKLVKRRTQRKITDDFSVMEQFEEKHGDAIYAPKKLKSVVQLEKVVGKKELEPFVTKPDKGEELVHVSDKRDEITVKTIDEQFSEEKITNQNENSDSYDKASESAMNFNDMEF